MQQPALELPNKAYILPDAIASWPPAWWFWLVLASLACVVIGLSLVLWIRHRQRTYRRQAQQLAQSIDSELSDTLVIERCLEAIKRCLVTEGHSNLASMTTEALLPVLDQQIRRNKHPLAPHSKLFSERLYRPNASLSEGERAALVQATCYWIRNHHA